MRLIKKGTFLLLVGLISNFTFGQNYSVHKKKKSYFGLAGGVNFSLPKVTDHYAVLTSVGSANDESLEKNYDKFFQNRGAQFSVRYSYNITNSISLVAGFGYQSIGFNYFTDYTLSDTVEKQNFSREMHHLQKISYFSLPIMARWDITSGQLKPYVQGGVFMDFRHQAKKVIRYDQTIDGEETENEITSSAEVAITDGTRKFNMGLMGGVGINYYTKYLRIGLESNFKYGFYKVVNDDARYSDVNGFALQYLDVLDQLKMSVVNVQLTLAVPITHSISSNILRRSKYYKRR